MVVKYLPGDFADHPDAFPASFGFKGSVHPNQGKQMPGRTTPGPKRAVPTMAASAPASNMHPHGHHIVGVEQNSGGAIHRHAHGGYTMHHNDGRVTHHMADGAPMGMAGGGRMPKSDEAQDKAMITKAVHQHEQHDHKGEAETALKLRRGGGIPKMKPRLPRGMRPKAARDKSPVNTAPANPMVTATAPNDMPGGNVPYGVQPSDEPANPPTNAMRRGGKVKC